MNVEPTPTLDVSSIRPPWASTSRLRQGQAQPRPGLACEWIADLAELLEDVRLVLGRDPDAGVGHGDPHIGVVDADDHPDGTAIGRVLDGVRQQVVEHLPEPAAVDQ